MQIPQFFSNPITDATQAAQLQNALMQQQIQRRQYEDTLESRRGFEEAMRGQQEQAQAYQVPDMFRYDATQSPEVKAYQAAQTANALVAPAPTSEGNITIKGTEADRAAEMNQLKAAADARLSQPQGMAYPSTMSQRGWQPPSDASYAYMQGVQQFQQAQQEQQVNFFNNRVKPLYDMWITTKDSSVKQKLMDQVEALRGRPEAGIAVQFMDAVKGVNLSSGGNISAGTIMTDGLKKMLLHGTTSPVMKQVIEGLPSGKPIPFELTGDWSTGNVTGTEGGKSKGAATGATKKDEFPNTNSGIVALKQKYNLTPEEQAQLDAIRRQKGINRISVQVNPDGSHSFVEVGATKYTGGGGGGEGDGGGGGGGTARPTTSTLRQIKMGAFDKTTPKNYAANQDKVYAALLDRYKGDEGLATEALQTMERNSHIGQSERRMASAAIAARNSLENVFIPTLNRWVKSRNFSSDRRALESLSRAQGSILDKGRNWLENWVTEQRLSPEGRAYAVAAFDAIRQVNQAVSTRGGAQKSLDWEHNFFSPSSSAAQLRAVADIELDAVRQAEAAYGFRKLPAVPGEAQGKQPRGDRESVNPQRRQYQQIVDYMRAMSGKSQAEKNAIWDKYKAGGWSIQELANMAREAGWVQ